MLRVLIAIAIAVPLYELLRWQVLRRARTALLRKARDYAKRHDVRVDLFKFGGKQLVREELLNDRRGRFFGAYMGKAKQRMKIQVNREALQRVVG